MRYERDFIIYDKFREIEKGWIKIYDNIHAFFSNLNELRIR